MKAQSNTKPPQYIKSRGRMQVPYNITEEIVEDGNEKRTIFNYDYVIVDKLTKANIIKAIMAEEIGIENEIALINNKFRGNAEDVAEYAKYQQRRADVKIIAIDVIMDTKEDDITSNST